MQDGMKYMYEYKHDEVYRTSFNRLTRLVFGFDFEEWYRKRFWDDRYVSHSIVYQNEVIANVSASKMDLTINGEKKKAIQLGTVMTHPDYRGRGLSRFLMDKVLSRYERECDLFFLFANPGAVRFYPKFDFVPIVESSFLLDVEHLAREKHSMRKLDVTKDEDLALIQQCVSSRKTISSDFGIENHLGIFMFYALNVYRDCIYYIENEHTIVLYKQKGEEMHLYDVVSQEKDGFHALLPKIIDKHTKRVQFYFTPDLFTDHADSKPFAANEDQLFVRPASALAHSVFRVPSTAHA